MRIGIFTDTYLPDINGVVSSCVILKEALESLGHTVFVVTNHTGAATLFEDNILRLPGLELKRLYGYKMSSPVNVFADDRIEQMQLDIIHVQTEYGVGIYGRQMAKALHIPTVYTYHTMWEDYTHYVNPLEIERVDRVSKSAIRSMSRKLANSVQGVIAPSQKTKDVLESYGVIAPIYIVPTGLNLKRFQPDSISKARLEDVKTQLHIQPEDHTLVFVGRMAKEKMLEMVIEAVSLSKDPHLRLVAVGSGPDLDDFQQEAIRFGCQDKVLFTGKVPSEDVPYYYAAADCFASASTTETQGMTYIEALAAGLPVFGRRDPVLKGLIEEGRTGGWFDSAQELAQKLDAYFERDSDKEQLAAVCRQKAAPYSEEIFGRKAQAVYEQAVIDYRQTWTAEKIRLKDDFAQVTLRRDADKDPLVLLMPLDDYFEWKMEVGTRLDDYMVSSYMEMQDYYEGYTKAKRKVLSQDMTSRQMRDYLVRRLGMDHRKAQAVVQEFQEKGWIDDETYAKDKARYWHESGSSRQLIRQKLVKAGIEQGLMESVLDNLDEEVEMANARQLSQRILRTVKEQSNRMKRQTVVHKLMSKGYPAHVAHEVGDTLELDGEEDALVRAFQKAGRLYASLEEPKRREKIRQYCLRKGFSASQVDELLLESRQDD